MRRLRAFPALLAVVVLAACAAESKWAPQEAVEQALYRPEGPTKLTLFTVQNVRNGNGAHSGLMVTGAHRALFDPAGTFYHPAAPERNDVHYGITENVLKVYIDYHARETFDVIIQEVEVSPEVAAVAMREIESYGAVPNAQCAISVSRILGRLPGFEGFPVGWFPNSTSEDFAAWTGATSQRITDDDADQNHGVLLQVTKAYTPATAVNE